MPSVMPLRVTIVPNYAELCYYADYAAPMQLCRFIMLASRGMPNRVLQIRDVGIGICNRQVFMDRQWDRRSCDSEPQQDPESCTVQTADMTAPSKIHV
eukprot:SAG25_NODE_275_length_10545_cov_4.715968_9_plen_98_part_00